MRISELFINNFRNYNSLYLTPKENLNILLGDNAQGKTNLLEAICFLLQGRSFRTSHEKDIINFESQNAKLKAQIQAYRQNFYIDINLSRTKSKLIKINNTSSSKPELTSNFGVIIFTPDQLAVIKGSPKERRKFLDLELASFHPQYKYYLTNYQKVLLQRNNLLKELKEKRRTNTSDLLELWDTQLFSYGAKIIMFRMEILRKLIPVAQKIHNQITSDREKLTVRYMSSLNLSRHLREELIYEQFKEITLKNRNQELFRGQTISGPHRDDLGFLINNKNITDFGSQGQQRTIILTLKFALIELWSNELNDVPIMLLDDVFFELDSNRQKYILDLIEKDVQVFITTTGINNISDNIRCLNQNSAVFSVRNGSVNKEEL